MKYVSRICLHRKSLYSLSLCFSLSQTVRKTQKRDTTVYVRVCVRVCVYACVCLSITPHIGVQVDDALDTHDVHSEDWFELFSKMPVLSRQSASEYGLSLLHTYTNTHTQVYTPTRMQICTHVRIRAYIHTKNLVC